MQDKGFTLPSPLASSALDGATKLLQWSSDASNHESMVTFSRSLTSSLANCFPSTYTSQRVRREKMWGHFHQLKTSNTFQASWQKFLVEGVGVHASPILYQYLTDNIFRVMIREHFPLQVTEQVEGYSSQPKLSYEVQNALRYAAGYIPRALRKRLERSSHPLKEELLTCLLDLTEDDDESGQNESEEWIDLIDRGGLRHVTNMAYSLLVAMELELRTHLANAVPKADFKEKVTAGIFTNEDVLFYWAMLAAEWEEDESKALLAMIIDLWVTIRGFSFASSWMEKYKLVKKQSLQKSKGIRKQLLATTCTTRSNGD